MRVLFFGRLRDLAGTSALDVTEAFETLAQLCGRLAETHPELAPALEQRGLRVAIDKAIVVGDARIAGAKEVAFMPPMSGG